ncbi:Esterase 1 [Hyphodiscus hymeniophilus]|uniref:Esterase 1 n=1 Tax=Hyphodiscus hymeniophilus TaxID=353542 RepID=A0A9P6VDQ1_9HELO|nr:Esterase 1 [Hyphodiscus hymeniophilus]
MADYSRYGHPSREWEEFIAINPLTATGLAPGQGIEDLQRATNKSREEASAHYLRSSGIRDRITFTDTQIPTQDGKTIGARIYRPKKIPDDAILPVYIYFHGGGFLFGTLASEDANCGRIVAALDIVVVNVCYRHTPHYKHPTQANDAWDAFNWVCNNLDVLGGDKRQVIVGGVSAGGALAASVMMRENYTKNGRIRGQVLCIPQLFHFGSLPLDQFKSEEVCSYYQHVDAPIIPRTQLEMFKGVLGADNQSDASLFVGIDNHDDVARMPRTAIIIAGMDPLRDEALLYANMLEENKYAGLVAHFEVD